MTDRRWMHCAKGGVVLLALVACSVAHGAAPKKNTEPRAFRDMDAYELNESLRELKMSALLRATAEATGNVAAIIDAIVLQADLSDDESRDAYYVEAIALAKKDAELQAKRIRGVDDENTKEFDDATIAYYKDKIRYFQLQGVKRGEPYMSRIIYLVASDADKNTLQKLTGDTAEDLLKTEKRLRGVIDTNQKGSKFVYLIPQLENIQVQLKYTGALVQYSSALGMPIRVPVEPGDVTPPTPATKPTTQPAEPQKVAAAKPTSKINSLRTERLQQAIDDLVVFAKDPDMGVQPYANLWRARAFRELGQYEAAQQGLAFTVSDKSIDPVKVEGYFELARCAIESSVQELKSGELAVAKEKLADAKKATDLFAEKALEISGEDAALGVDFKKLNLGSYMYEEWIRTLRKKMEGDPLVAEMIKASAGPFNEFYEKYGDNPPAIMAAVVFLRDKFEGRDPKEMPAMVLVLLAQLELREAHALQKNGPTPESDAQSKKAKGMFESVLARDDEASKMAYPDALWGLGNAYILLRDNFKAADQFNLLVEKFPTHARARDAGINAVKITSTLITQWEEENPTAPIPVERLEKYRDALLTILTHWGADAKASQYWYDLGLCYDQLSERQETEAGRDKLLADAIGCYEKVPAGSENALEAGYFELDIQYRMLQGKPVDATTKEKARVLMRKMLAYAMKVKPMVQSAKGEDKKKMGQWGAVTAFHAELLRYEYLGDETTALSRIETLADKWPGTRALVDSRIFLIRKLLSRGQVARGVEEFEKFQAKYGDTQAQVLMQDVVETLKETIDELVPKDEQKEELASFRKAYLDFATQVYESKKDSPNKAERDSVTMLRGDALVQSGDAGNGAKALVLFEALKKEQDATKKVKVAAIATKMEGYIKTVKSTPDDINQVRLRKTEFDKSMDTLGLSDWNGYTRVSVRTAFKRLNNKDLAPKDVVNACKAAKYRLTRAYKSAQKTLSRRVEVNANVIRGLARAYMLTGQPAKALPYLRMLTAGLSATTNRAMYWEAWLDMAKAQYEVHKDDPKRLVQLRGMIQKLRAQDRSMGGARFKGQFNDLDAKARRGSES